jgi:hypothetical protein
VDFNQASIVDALRAIGCSVLSLAAVGKGCPDLLVTAPAFPHRTILLEVKNGELPPSARAMTPDQVKFHREWKGEIHVVTSVEEALRAVMSYHA